MFWKNVFVHAQDWMIEMNNTEACPRSYLSIGLTMVWWFLCLGGLGTYNIAIYFSLLEDYQLHN